MISVRGTYDIRHVAGTVISQSQIESGLLFVQSKHGVLCLRINVAASAGSSADPHCLQITCSYELMASVLECGSESNNILPAMIAGS